VAQQLRKAGILKVRPLAGGFFGWKELGYPLDEFYPENKEPIRA